MTNHWADMANSTNVVVMGANPTENHPASMAHINAARGSKTHPKAKLIVIDPRKTRTALQADTYVRIRPGTDIAFVNGLVNSIITWMEANPADPKSINFFSYLNDTVNGTFFTDGSATTASTSSTPVPGNARYTDARFLVNPGGTDYVRDRVLASTGAVTATGPDNTTISNFPQKAATVTADPNTVYNKLKAHVAPYTPAVVANICGCTEAELATVATAFIDNSRCASFNSATPGTIVQTPTSADFRSTTMLYAMGITQHTCGSQNVKSFAVLQSLMGNVGRYGGGINALRGIHNVQGSTDMGLLYGNIPAYSGNPSLQYPADPNAFGKYMDALWGNPLSGTGTRALMNGSYDDAYNTAAMALQQRGFYNMTQKFFGTPDTVSRANIDQIYSLWPKGPGDQHLVMFRKMITGETKALVCWGQNPAVTEPNQTAIRAALKNLDLLVVTDMFETETAACDRKAGGVTYLIPAAAHVETAGSATNSGRTLQWRYQSRKPAGNSKADLEILFRLAYALDGAGAFSHISAGWAGVVTFSSVYDELYGSQYLGGWTPLSPTAFEAIAGTAEQVAPTGNVVTSAAAVTGCELISDRVFMEMALPSAAGGTIWIYTGAYNNGATWQGDNIPGGTTGAYAPGWTVHNRAKSRNRTNTGTNAFHGWGYSWLVNRRVLYNNNSVEAPGDTADFFMGPDSCARLFVSTSTAVLNYSRWYRTIHRLADVPKKADGTTPTFHVLPGRFPAHVEPYETPRLDWETWGKNTAGGGFMSLLPTVAGSPVTPVGSPADYPLILTSIRCVEHFQGGPITRNNGLNVEVEPEPWIEINSTDAAKYGIVDGDWVNVITARGNSKAGQLANTVGTWSGTGTDNFGKGFKARVGIGLSSSQRVAPGVVAIPWHWGDRGLSTGSRANDLCIDAFDANTAIPESKACLCKLSKV